MGEGNGNGKVRVWLQKNCSRRKGNFLVYDPTFYHLCFSESRIRMFFQVSGVFSESGGKFCRIEVRHFFPPKGGSRYYTLGVRDYSSNGLSIVELGLLCNKYINAERSGAFLLH